MTRPPILYDVLGIAGLLLVLAGLCLLWFPSVPIVMGVLLIAVGIRGAAATPNRQQTHRPRRRERIEFLRTDRVIGREVLMPEQFTDKGKLIDPSEDDDREEW